MNFLYSNYPNEVSVHTQKRTLDKRMKMLQKNYGEKQIMTQMIYKDIDEITDENFLLNYNELFIQF